MHEQVCQIFSIPLETACLSHFFELPLLEKPHGTATVAAREHESLLSSFPQQQISSVVVAAANSEKEGKKKT